MPAPSGPWEGAVAALDPDALAQLAAAALARLAGERPQIVTRETAAAIDDRASMPLPIPQWTTADGQARGVVIQALGLRERMLAEQRATVAKRDGSATVNAWRQTAEEVVAGIVEPRGLTVDMVLSWNEQVIEYVHAAILRLAPLPAAWVAQELARIAGGPPPAVPDAAHRPNPERVPDELGADREPAPGLADASDLGDG